VIQERVRLAEADLRAWHMGLESRQRAICTSAGAAAISGLGNQPVELLARSSTPPSTPTIVPKPKRS